MNIYIGLYLALGLCFGVTSFSHRHLFSEGPRRADAPLQGATAGERLMWALVCTFLWPLMLLTGLNSLWILARRKARAGAGPSASR